MQDWPKESQSLTGESTANNKGHKATISVYFELILQLYSENYNLQQLHFFDCFNKKIVNRVDTVSNRNLVKQGQKLSVIFTIIEIISSVLM